MIQIRDIELELDEEKRRHAETIKILRKKERHVKEVLIQSEEDQRNIILLQENCDKLSQKIGLYKRQMQETVRKLFQFLQLNLIFIFLFLGGHVGTERDSLASIPA